MELRNSDRKKWSGVIGSRRELLLGSAGLGIIVAAASIGESAVAVPAVPSLRALAPIRPKVKDYEAWPHLFRTPKGAILCGYTARTQHLNVKGSQALIARSTSVGTDWKRSLHLQSTDAGWGLEAIGTNREGSIIAIASENRSLTHDKPQMFPVYASNDDGVTFAKFASITPGNKFSIATIGALSTTPSGTLIAPWHGDGWGLVRSMDQGKSWEILAGANGGKWPLEGRIFTASDESLLMTGRNYDQGFGLMLLRSRNDGATWTKAQATGLGVVHEALYVDGDSVKAVLIDRDSGTISWTTTTTTRLLADATDWEAPKKIGSLDPSGAAAEQGYPELAKVDEETLLMAAYDGQNPKTDIRIWRIENF